MKRKTKKITSLFLLFAMTASLLSVRNPATSVQAGENSRDTETSSKVKTINDKRSLAISPDQVTCETTQDYVHAIYANGMPLIIVASEFDVRYARIYVDQNENGIADADEELTAFQGDGTIDGAGGIYYDEDWGYFLTNSVIYGGAKDGSQDYDTRITLTGPSDADSSDYTVRLIFGGNASGTLTGDTFVNLTGGNAGWVFGGSNSGELIGNTEVHAEGGYRLCNLYAGNCIGTIHGNTSLMVNGQVCSVFGGNETSGTVTGNTSLVFGKDACVTGWVYGGGAGYSDDEITEVKGSTNITINGGEFQNNVYGGGGWRGSMVKDSNITINDGDIGVSCVYGGGEEASAVTGKVSITVNGGTIDTVCAAGAGFNNTVATVGSAEVHLNGGSIARFLTFPDGNNTVCIEGDLTFEAEGEGIAKTWLFFGQEYNINSLHNVSISLKDGKVPYLTLCSPIEGTLDLSFDNADTQYFSILENVFAGADKTNLIYQNCGAADNKWGEYDVLVNSTGLQNAENPMLRAYNWNGNRFQSITLKDSYVNFVDTSTWNEERGLREMAERLIIDGGALRIIGIQRSNMPDTTFLNNPLLLRSSDKQSISFAGTDIEGTARVQWLAMDGQNIPEVPTAGIVETENGIPARTFSAARKGYGMKTNSTYYSASGDMEEWWGMSWCTDVAENICTCRLPYTGLAQTCFILPTGESEVEFILADRYANNPGYKNGCKMLEHQETVPSVSYSLIPEEIDVETAAIVGDRLTVSGLGTLGIRVSRELNGVKDEYTANIRIIRAPEEQMFTMIHEAETDLTFDFEGFDVYTFRLFNSSETPRVEITDQCTWEEETEPFRFILPASYLSGLDLGEYKFHAELWTNNAGIYVYDFTVEIVSPKEVTNPAIEVLGDDFHYDGKAKEPEIIVRDGDTVIPESEYSVSYENNIQAGTATIMISDNDKGLYTVSGSTTFEIINEFQPENGREYTTSELNSNGWTNTDFVITAKDGYLLSTGNTLSDEWVTSVTGTDETNNGKLAFYVKNTENGRISLVTEEDYKLDRTAPESYDAAFNGKSVKKEIGFSAFEQMFKNTVEVTMTAVDSLSGIDEIAYYPSEKVLNQEQLEKVTEWIPGSSLSVEPEDEKQFIIYGKAADRAGNMVYFGTAGAEFDLTPPVLEGAEEEMTYYTTQKVTVTDRNLAEVTLNGTPVSGSALLPGNVDQTYTIRAVDQAGNESVLTVTMKPISSLASGIANLTEDNVTSTDQETISNILEVLTDENTTEEERTALEQLQEQTQQLQNRIDKAASAIQTDTVQEAGDISIENVQMTDQEKLEQAKIALETALKEYPGNYTEVEKLAVQEDISRMEAALESIEKVQGVADAIVALPDAGQVSADDVTAEAVILQAKDAYDALSKHEQSLVGTASVEKLNQLLAALTDYRILEGDNGVWEESQNKGLTFKASGAFSKFTGVKVDGILLAAENYEAKEGSTILTLRPDCLKRLSEGKHTLTVLYTDGEVSAEFTVTRNAEPVVSETPEPGSSETPEPGSSETPEPGSSETPEPGVSETPKPGASDKPELETSAVPEPGTSDKPEPGTSAVPEPENSGQPAGTDNTGAPASGTQPVLSGDSDNGAGQGNATAGRMAESPKTGDKSQPWWWFLAMLGAIALSRLGLYGKRRTLRKYCKRIKQMRLQ